MKNYIANIVSVKGTVKGKIFNVVDSIDKIDPRFPTLIIGWDNVKGKYEGISILDWKINDHLFWTHYKNVKRVRYEQDIKNFKEMSLKRLGSYVTYTSFSLMTSGKKRIEDMVESFRGPERKYCYVTQNEVFVYYPSSRKVIGISLDEADYMGIGKEYIVSCLKNPANRIAYNDYDIPFEIKNRDEYRRYMVPFLLEVFESE